MPPSGDASGPAAGLLLREITRPDAFDAVAQAWRELARTSALSPFQAPDWLLPWWRHYGVGLEPRLLTWWDGERLVGLAPLALRSPWTRLGDRVRELVFWGAAGQTRSPLMRGFVDLLAAPDHDAQVRAAFDAWLDSDASDWNLFSLLRLPSGSPTPDRLRALAAQRHWRTVHPGQADISMANILDLPADLDAWDARSDRKARYNMRREVRLFAERANGRFDVVADAAGVAEALAAIARLAGERWQEREHHFRGDPAFGAFMADAAARMAEAGQAYAVVARDDDGIVAAALTLAVNGRAAVPLIGVSSDAAYNHLAVGKNLFARSIAEAITRGARTYDFLLGGDYKRTFWHASPVQLDNLLVGRGLAGSAVTAYAQARRVAREDVLPRVRGRGSVRGGHSSRGGR